MSATADQLLDELMKLLNYDELNGRQLKVKLFESSLKIKTLSEELMEATFVKNSTNRGIELLKVELSSVKQELNDAGDRVDMLEDVIDKKQKIIDEQGYSPSLLVKRYNSTSLVEGLGQYCGGVAYTESDVISLENKLDRARKDFEELEIENKNLVEKIKLMETEIDYLESHPNDYQIQQDFRIKELILSGEGLEKDFDSLELHSKQQESFIEEQKTIISQLNHEVGLLKKIVSQKEEIIKDQREIIAHKEEALEASGVSHLAKDLEMCGLKAVITQKEEIIEASGVSLAAKDLEIDELMTVIAEGEAVNFSDVARDLQVELVEKDLEIEKLKNSLDEKNDIIDYYFSST